MPDTQTYGSGDDRRNIAIATAADDPDFIRELGDRIASLTIAQAAALADYLKQIESYEE